MKASIYLTDSAWSLSLRQAQLYVKTTKWAQPKAVLPSRGFLTRVSGQGHLCISTTIGHSQKYHWVRSPTMPDYGKEPPSFRIQTLVLRYEPVVRLLKMSNPCWKPKARIREGSILCNPRKYLPCTTSEKQPFWPTRGGYTVSQPTTIPTSPFVQS